MTRPVHIFLIILLFAVFAMPFARPAEASSQRGSLVQGNTEFAVQLQHKLGVSGGNLFFSPYSISSALGMTYGGASGNTAHEMRNVLHFPADQALLHAAFKGLNRELVAAAQKSGQKLNIANALVLTGGNVSREFKGMLKDNYDAEIFPGGLDTINDWVRNKTEGKIDKILEELSGNSVGVLLNAIYFKGVWERQFQKSSTHDAPFRLSADAQVKVSLMHQKNDFALLTEQDFQAVSIPYKGKALSMVVLLPKAIDGLAALEKQVTTHNLTKWLAKLDEQQAQKIDLYLPKFKLETSYDLVPPSKKMGIMDAFTPGEADFRGMGWPKGNLYIAQIKHKAFVEVNEEGTEAAAATAVEMATKSVRHYPVFRADHPFLFIIRDNQSGSILFMGRMVNPDSK